MRIECQLSFDFRPPTLFHFDQIHPYNKTQKHLRGGDDDFGIDQFLVKLGVLALLVGGCNQGVALVFQPLPDTELILGCSEELRYLLGVLSALVTLRISHMLPFPSIEVQAGLKTIRGRLTSYRTKRTFD